MNQNQTRKGSYWIHSNAPLRVSFGPNPRLCYLYLWVNGHQCTITRQGLEPRNVVNGSTHAVSVPLAFAGEVEFTANGDLAILTIAED